MKHLLVIILTAVFCAMFSAVSVAQTVSTPEQELAAIYAQQDRSIAARDAPAIAAFYAPNYVAETKQGIIKRAESLQNLQNFFDSTSRISVSRTTLEKIEDIEGTFVAYVSRQMKGMMILRAAQHIPLKSP